MRWVGGQAHGGSINLPWFMDLGVCCLCALNISRLVYMGVGSCDL